MIKTIIFDFGDVFINLDKSATEKELNRLGVNCITQEMLEIASNYEKGLINTSTLLKEFKKLYPSISSNDFINAWNSIILDFPEYRLNFIETLTSKKSFKTILLSNTNALHIEKVIENMSDTYYERFKKCFDKFYLSHEIHLSKPHFDIYNYVLEKNNLNPTECLFIDDTSENTIAANTLGLHTWNIDPKNEDIVNLFEIKKELF